MNTKIRNRKGKVSNEDYIEALNLVIKNARQWYANGSIRQSEFLDLMNTYTKRLGEAIEKAK